MSKEELIDWSLYQCYEDGRIYSKSYNKNRFLTICLNNKGYVRAFLNCIDGKRRTFQWHRVIWVYFNGAIPEGYQVNHIDENKQNNALSNLNLMTPKENSNWGTRTSRMAAKMKGRKFSEEHKAKLRGRKLSEDVIRKISEKKINGKLSKPVVAVDDDGNVVYEFPSTMEAKRKLGLDSSAIAKCCRGERRTCGGYRWYYKEYYLRMIKGVA